MSDTTREEEREEREGETHLQRMEPLQNLYPHGFFSLYTSLSLYTLHPKLNSLFLFICPVKHSLGLNAAVAFL